MYVEAGSSLRHPTSVFTGVTRTLGTSYQESVSSRTSRSESRRRVTSPQILPDGRLPRHPNPSQETLEVTTGQLQSCWGEPDSISVDLSMTTLTERRSERGRERRGRRSISRRCTSLQWVVRVSKSVRITTTSSVYSMNECRNANTLFYKTLNKLKTPLIFSVRGIQRLE